MKRDVPDRWQLTRKPRRLGRADLRPPATGKLRRLGRLPARSTHGSQQRRSGALGVPPDQVDVDPSREQARRL
jgi:hypothetical protein